VLIEEIAEGRHDEQVRKTEHAVHADATPK
jgi:hypothetical protein